MKRSKSLINITLLILLSSCDFNSSGYFSSDLSSSKQESSSSLSSSSSNIIDESDLSARAKLVEEKEAYKALVDREKIQYSTKLENDINHKVTSLEIFEINDTHGAFYDEDEDAYIYSISRVKTLIEEETIDPYSVIKIANGDLMQGSSFSNMLLGEPAIASCNEMGFDCFVIGNHEFDWGLDSLSVYKDGNPLNGELDCPFLGANIIDKDGNLPSFIEPYTIVYKGDVKVGIIGLIGDALETSISKVSLGGYSFTSSVDAVTKYGEILKKEEKCDVIIVSIHDHSPFINSLFAQVADVDAIINAHDHSQISEWVYGYGIDVPVCESNTKNLTVGKITLDLDANKIPVEATIKHYYPMDYDKDSELQAIMDVYYEIVDEYQNTVIAYHEGGFTKKDLAISVMNYICKKYDVDVAFVNTTGVRAYISDDEITNADIYEVFPFDNELYYCEVTGAELKRLVGSGYYINDTGIGMGTFLNTGSISSSKAYKVITVDFIATKSNMANYFNQSHGLIKLGDYIRDCALEDMSKNYKK